MSRSYKRIPVCKQQNYKLGKKQANRLVRKTKEPIANGSAFKKVFCSWDICDYRTEPTSFDKFLESDLEDIDMIEAQRSYHKWFLNK